MVNSPNSALQVNITDRCSLDGGAQAAVRQVSPVNRYSYSMLNLILAYAVVVSLSLIAILVGFIALLRNGVSHDMSFSTIIRTTRNSMFEQAVQGQTLGALPMQDHLARQKLIFGVQKGIEREGVEVSIATFGDRHSVSSLRERSQRR